MKKINSNSIQVLDVVYPMAEGPRWIRPFVNGYCFFLLLFASLWKDGYDLPPSEKWTLMITWLVAIECLHQITYWLGRKNVSVRTLAIVKCLLYWIISTACTSVYISMLETIPIESELPLPRVGWYLFLAGLSWLGTNHSLSLRVRFVMLYGEFRHKKEV